MFKQNSINVADLGAGSAWSPGPADAGSQEQGKAEVSEVVGGPTQGSVLGSRYLGLNKMFETIMLLHYYDIERVIILIGIKAC